jgi:HK97 family phage prohead protease
MDRVTFAATGALDGNTLTGIAHAFGQRTRLGSGWVEFAPGSFDRALRKGDVRAFVNHDSTLILGRQRAGTLRLSAEPTGLRYAIDLPETSYAADLRVVIDRGDIDAMSFGIIPGKFRLQRAPDGRQLMLHTQVQDLFDISPVSLPAFEGTSIQLHARALADESLRSQLVRARARVQEI